MEALVAVARRLGVRRVYGEMLAHNDAMRELARRSGFAIQLVPGDARLLRAERAIP
jgi:acetyltransferase